jgi:hypothetical protein
MKHGTRLEWLRKIPDLDWLRCHLRRTNKAPKHLDLDDNTALVRFALSMPPKEWRGVGTAWRQRGHRRNIADILHRHIEGTATAMLLTELKRRNEEIAELRKRLARYEEAA